jgi:uncharacterized protein YjbI with pentapeptide repeats
MRMRAIAVAAAGGIIGSAIAILTYFEFRRQNSALINQNELFREQNAQVLEQNKQDILTTNTQIVSSLIGDLYAARENFSYNSDWDIPKPLIFRILTVSQALIPYDSISYSSIIYHEISSTKVSRERGELLQAIEALSARFPLIPNPNFGYSYLEKAKLERAKLQGIYLEGAYIRDANLKFADLSHSYLKYADLGGCDLDSILLNDTNLEFTYLRNADLEGANLMNADLEGSDLRGAYLKGAILIGADLNGAKLEETYLESAQISADANYNVYVADSLIDFRQYALENGADTVFSK